MRHTNTLLFLLAMFIGSCNCHEYVKCSTGALDIYVVNFSAAEADSIYVKRYKANTSFATLIDSTSEPLYPVGPDTFTAGLSVEAGYDYYIMVAPAHRNYKVWGIATEGSEYQDMKNCCTCKTMPMCFNYINEIQVDGKVQAVAHGESPSSGAVVYLVK